MESEGVFLSCLELGKFGWSAPLRRELEYIFDGKSIIECTVEYVFFNNWTLGRNDYEDFSLQLHNHFYSIRR